MIYRNAMTVASIILILLSAFYIYKSRQANQEYIAELQEVNRLLENQIDTVIDIYEGMALQTFELRGTQQAIGSQLTKQQEETRRLQNDVQEIKEWADTALPADIIGLRQRPAITGADLYRSLSTSNAMRTQSE